jgi:predicted AAA+ superfamily ATPase
LETDEIELENVEDLNLILEVYFEIVNYKEEEDYYIFLDEIQNVK